MPVTLSVPPKVVRDVESFAARSGTTLDALVLAYLVKTATEERRTRSKRSRNPVLKFCGILPKGEAERLRAVVSEQRVITRRCGDEWATSFGGTSKDGQVLMAKDICRII